MAVVPTVVRSKLSVIILAIMAQTQQALGFTPDQVIATIDDDPVLDPYPDSYLLVRIGSLLTDQAIAAAAGRIEAVVTSRLKFILRIRLAQDDPGRAIAWLTTPSLGYLDKVHSLWDSMHIFAPTDQVFDELLAEPMRLLSCTEPRPRKSDPSWGESTSEFEVKWQLALNQTRQ
jgi:hypothetical protein